MIKWKHMAVDPQEIRSWRSDVRSAMHAASQLPGRGPTDVDDAPAWLQLYVNQKSDYDNIGCSCCLPWWLTLFPKNIMTTIMLRFLSE